MALTVFRAQRTFVREDRILAKLPMLPKQWKLSKDDNIDTERLRVGGVNK